MSEDTPKHLGGHGGITHTDEGALNYFYDTLECRSMIDLGCGPGGQVALAREIGFESKGIDGDASQKPDVLIDFTKNSLELWEPVDLCWCVEFVEHVDPRHMINYLGAFTVCKFILLTHALPGESGHHHVNCRPLEYWRGVMAAIGYVYDPFITEKVRSASTMKRDFVRRRGVVFKPFRR